MKTPIKIGDLYILKTSVYLWQEPKERKLLKRACDLPIGTCVQLVDFIQGDFDYGGEVMWYKLLGGMNIGWQDFWKRDKDHGFNTYFEHIDEHSLIATSTIIQVK